jgi:hypothetical protein
MGPVAGGGQSGDDLGVHRTFLPAPAIGLLLLAPGAGVAGADVQGFHYTRPIEVPSPGWVQVPLDLGAVQHMAAGGADLHVVSAAGGEIPLRIEPAASRNERRTVETFRVQPAADGWWLLVDLGAGAVPHERLDLTPLRPPLPPPDRLESSPDGTAWQPLAAGDAEPVSPSAAALPSGEIPISYPVIADRYLRLHWPRRAEAPRFSAVAVEAVTGPTLAVASPSTDCTPGLPGATYCTLALPAAGQVVRRLALEVEGKGVIGYRLYAARDARWEPLAAGVWQPAGPGATRARHLIAGGAETVGAVLRLALYAAAGRPRLVNYGVDLNLETVLFQAEAPGSYTLAYGGAPRQEARRRPPAPFGVRPVWLEPGPEKEGGLPPLPAAATAPAVRLASARFAASWRIAAPSAKPGTLVRLEIPARVYGAARADLGNLRLVAGDRQIPFQLESPQDPVLAGQDDNLHFSKGGRHSVDSTVEIHLAEAGLPLTQIELTTPALPLRRAVGVRYLEPASIPAREVRQHERPAVVRGTWDCRPTPPLPCSQLLPLTGRAPSVLETSVHDGDNPPLAGLGAALWRRRDVLLFVWPEGDAPVRLVAGPDTLTAPSYDLQALGDALLSYPWQPAELSQGGVPVRSRPWWSRWVRPMILAAAAVGLLFLLRRILSET